MAEAIFNGWKGKFPVNPGDGMPAIKALAGWGGLVINDPGIDVPGLLRVYLEAVQGESCGRCVPCRLGSKAMLEIIEGLGQNGLGDEDRERLAQLCVLARDGSMCEFGQSFPTPILQALEGLKGSFSSGVFQGGPLGAALAFHKVVSAPCISMCPAGIKVPDFAQEVSWGNFEAAMASIQKKTVFLDVLGRLCDAPCESGCRRNNLDEPISIRGLERFIGDNHLSWRKGPAIPPNELEQHVAVVGAGLAGLSAAYQLRRRGYQVAVLDAATVPGGLLVSAVPAFRLPREVLARDIRVLDDMGVKFKLGTALGSDISLAELQEKYQAVVLATGRGQTAPLEVPGLGKAEDGLLLLQRFNRQEEMDLGSRVAVVGEGHLAIACARVLRFLGVREVFLLSGKKRVGMKAGSSELFDAEEEGVRIFDSINLQGIFPGDGKEQVFKVVREDELLVFPVDTVVAAAGREADLGFLPKNVLGLDIATLGTRWPGVFAAGDLVNPGGGVVQAVASGNNAALAVIDYLGGERETGKDLQDLARSLGICEPGERVAAPGGLPRAPEEVQPVEQRLATGEVRRGMEYRSALQEAGRCLRCYRMAVVVT